jgi:predicted RNA-binding Zn ribbon-like protein
MNGGDAPRSGGISRTLCLDFVNTLSDRPKCAEEKLSTFGDLLEWGRRSSILSDAESDLLARSAARRPGEADRALRRALRFREAAYRVFSALAAGERPPPRDATELDRAVVKAFRALRLKADADGFRWYWGGAENALDRVLWPVARSTAELLTSNDRRWVRECAATDCSWLFLDQSRTRRRRWCDMSTCGNREKARRHYRRTKAAST